MSITLTPSTGKPGTKFNAWSTCKASTPTLIKIDGVVVAPSFTSDSSGVVQKQLTVPAGLDGQKVVVSFQQYTKINGVSAWRQISSAPFVVSNPVPLAYSTNIAAGSTIGGSLTWAASVTSGKPTKFEFSVDSVIKASVPAPGPYSIPLDTKPLPNGTHLLTVVGYDALGAHTPAGGNVTIYNLPKPDAPTGLTGVPGDGFVDLSWS